MTGLPERLAAEPVTEPGDTGGTLGAAGELVVVPAASPAGAGVEGAASDPTLGGEAGVSPAAT